MKVTNEELLELFLKLSDEDQRRVIAFLESAEGQEYLREQKDD